MTGIAWVPPPMLAFDVRIALASDVCSDINSLGTCAAIPPGNDAVLVGPGEKATRW